MAKFGVQQTNIDPISNEVTAKAGVRDDSLAQFVGVASQAVGTGLDFYGESKAQSFRKDAESGYRQVLGLDTKSDVEASDTPSVTEFKANVEKYAQMTKMGRGTKAQILLEQDLKARITQEPYLADRYRRVAEGIKSDYAAITRMAEVMDTASKGNNDKRITRIDKYAYENGVPTVVPDGQGGMSFVPLENMSEEQLDWFEQYVQMTRQEQIAGENYNEAVDRQMAVERFGMDKGSYARAGQAHGMAVTRFNQDQLERDLVGNTTRALTFQLSTVVQSIMASPAPPEEKAKKLAELRAAANLQARSRFSMNPDGSPSYLPPDKVDLYSRQFSESFVNPYIDLLVGGSSDYATNERVLKDLQTRAGIDLGPSAASLKALVDAAGPAASAYVVDAIRANEGTDYSLATGVSQQINQLGETVNQTFNRKVDYFVTGATQGIETVPKEYQPMVLGSYAKQMVDLATPGNPVTQDFSTHPEYFSGQVIGVTKQWERFSNNDKQALQNAVSSRHFIDNVASLPPMYATATAQAAGAILATGIEASMADVPEGDLQYDDSTERLYGQSGAIIELNSQLEAAKAYERLIPNGKQDTPSILKKYFGLEVQEPANSDSQTN